MHGGAGRLLLAEETPRRASRRSRRAADRIGHPFPVEGLWNAECAAPGAGSNTDIPELLQNQTPVERPRSSRFYERRKAPSRVDVKASSARARSFSTPAWRSFTNAPRSSP